MPISSQIQLQVGRRCHLRALGRLLIVEIQGISGATIWISYPFSEPLEEGTGVELEFHHRDGFVGYHARVAVALRHSDNGIMLERCETSIGRIERRDWRVPANFSAWLRRPGSKEKLRGRLLDLSVQGARAEMSSEFQAGELVELIIQLPELSAHLLMAQVMYCEDRQYDGTCHLGLQFVDVDRRTRDAITWFLYDRIRRLYAEELRDMYPPCASRTRSPGHPVMQQVPAR